MIFGNEFGAESEVVKVEKIFFDEERIQMSRQKIYCSIISYTAVICLSCAFG